jgi:hypothetical protein
MRERGAITRKTKERRERVDIKEERRKTKGKEGGDNKAKRKEREH